MIAPDSVTPSYIHKRNLNKAVVASGDVLESDNNLHFQYIFSTVRTDCLKWCVVKGDGFPSPASPPVT